MSKTVFSFFFPDQRGTGHVQVQGRVLTTTGKFVIGSECQPIRTGHTLTSDKQNRIALVGQTVALEQLRSLVQKIAAEQVEAKVLTQARDAH